jgi:hypothetical protein
MSGILHLKVNEAASTPSRQLRQFGDSGSRSQVFFVPFIDEVDQGEFLIVQHLSHGTFNWVNTMPSLSQEELEFQQQKDAFSDIPPIILAQFQNMFVVSHNGNILDSDFDLPTLTARFFGHHGDMPVYITKIGEQVEDRFDTPFFD